MDHAADDGDAVRGYRERDVDDKGAEAVDWVAGW